LPLTRSKHLLPFAAVGRLLRRAGLPDGCLDAPDTLVSVVAEARFRALKADPVLKDVPVLMLTMVDNKSKGYSLGATDYLTKPVDRVQIHNALAKYYTPGGFDFLLEMRARPEWQDIPVIVLTARDLTDEDRRILSGRVEQIVEKGACAHDQVVNLVHKALDPTLAIQ